MMKIISNFVDKYFNLLCAIALLLCVAVVVVSAITAPGGVLTGGIKVME